MKSTQCSIHTWRTGTRGTQCRNVRPVVFAGNAWWVGCVGCHKCRASAENKKKRCGFAERGGARWRGVFLEFAPTTELSSRILWLLVLENKLHTQHELSSFRSLHTICSTEGLKMLQTCFLRWWKAQFLDIGVKPQLELGISLKLETFFQARYLEAFQRLPPDLVMCLADWCSQVGERYVCCGAEWASDGLCSLWVSTALETLDSSACCILFSPDFVVSERLFPWKIPQGCGTISSKIPMMRRRSGVLSLHVSDCVIRSVCPRAVMVTATDRTYRHILSLSLSIFRTFEEVFAQTPLKTLIDFDFWGQLVWSPWFEPTNTLRAALDTWGARPATWNSERCVRPRRTLPWGRLVPASSRGTSRCGTKSRETHGDPWDSASWQKSRKECEWTEWP